MSQDYTVHHGSHIVNESNSNQHKQSAETPRQNRDNASTKKRTGSRNEEIRAKFAETNKVVAGKYAAVMHAPFDPGFGAISVQVYPQQTFYVRPPPSKRKGETQEETDQRKIVKGFGGAISKEFNLGQRKGFLAKAYDYAIRKKIIKEPALFYGYKNTSKTDTDYIDIAAPPDELWGLYAVDLDRLPNHILHCRPGWCWGFSEGVKLDFSYAENFLTANHFVTKMSPLWETFSGDGVVLLRAPTALRVFQPGENRGQKFDRDDIFAYSTPKLGVSFVVDPRSWSGFKTNVVQLWRGENMLAIQIKGPGQVVESRGIARETPPVDKEKEQAELLEKLEQRQKNAAKPGL